ncbi:T9SS type A sorting domain-containing protein [Reichenbachiella versicolor]|uniref:T9SS type A sorting domain-containing protein n=1 Tax=Reichenbachiella versicolor TaxID=1821036 RepID=UPI000D6E2304|nr:T9SS type A sorting domain-containing protein [Reichenbachiella versicolor]
MRTNLPYLIFGFLFFATTFSYAQISTIVGLTGNWENDSSWDGVNSPGTTNITYNNDITINGYITSGSLSFASIGTNTFELLIKDTLVVNGSLSFDANSINLKVDGLLVVLGDLDAGNKVDLSNSGNIAVTGDLTLPNNGNSDYTGSGSLYVDGTINGSGTAATAATSVQEPISNLDGTGDDSEQTLYDFITDPMVTTLPVELYSFNVLKTSNAVKIQWSTVSETDNDYFEVMRSIDGYNFKTIATIEGAKNSNELLSYSYTDYEAFDGTFYYRLKQTDLSGDFEIFDIKKITLGETVENVKAFPNPVTNGDLNIKVINSSIKGQLFVQIYDTKGFKVEERYFMSKEPFHLETLHFPNLKGLHIIKIQGDGLTHSSVIIFK